MGTLHGGGQHGGGGGGGGGCDKTGAYDKTAINTNKVLAIFLLVLNICY